MKITRIDVSGYEHVAKAEDPESGLKAFIAVHNTVLGPALGGLRMWTYEHEDDALTDALRLSRGMTFKSAVARTGLGGGKSVIIGNPHTQKTPELFQAMGKFVESFAGKYITAEDVGVGISDLLEVRKNTNHVTGLARDMGGSGNPSPYTALGCFEGVKAAAIEAWGSEDLTGKLVAIQGPGNVGFPLGEHLVKAGARLIVCDVNPKNVERAKVELNAEVVSTESVYDQECDIFAPCALGAVLNDDTIPRLKCKVVAGAANNVLLDEDRHSRMVMDRGIVYAPDYVINAGGIINVSLELEPGGYDEVSAVSKIRNIHDALLSIFKTARERGITTHAAAQELAEQNLGEGSTQRSGDAPASTAANPA
jgi:leucine dehydrogenase